MKRLLFIPALLFSAALHTWLIFSLQPSEAGRQPILPIDLTFIPEPEIDDATQDASTLQTQTVSSLAAEDHETPASMRQVAKRDAPSLPATEQEDGSFAGMKNITPGPRLRIEWPEGINIRAILEAGQIRLAVIHTDGPARIVCGVSFDRHGRAQRSTNVPDLTRYDPEVRNVTHLGAFQPIRRQLALVPGEQLILALPLDLSETVRSKQQEAIVQEGLTLRESSITTGRFVVRDAAISFTVTQVLQRED